MAGGSNSFVYADSTPAELTDTYGLCPWCVPIVQGVGARPVPTIIPRPTPVAQGVRSAIRQMERVERQNPSSKYNQRRVERILQDNGLRPRIRPDQMTETIDSCPVPPRISPNTGAGRVARHKFINKVFRGINRLREDGLLDHSPVPIVPETQIWPSSGERSNVSQPAELGEKFEKCYAAGLCI